MINSISNVTANGVGHLACDSDADITDLPEFARANNLRLGTDCVVIDSGKVLMMKSDFTFKEI